METKTQFHTSFLRIVLHGAVVLFVSSNACSPSWIESPPSPFFVLRMTDGILVWKYDLGGCSIEFAKWGKVENNLIQAYISHHSDINNVVNNRIGKIEWRKMGTMIIKNVTQEDEGTYGCFINLSKGRILQNRRTFMKVVKEKPTILTALPVTSRKREGDGPITFTVEAEADPKPVIIWEKNDVAISNSSGYEITTVIVGNNSKNETRVKGILRLSTIKRSDRGTITAKVAYGNNGPHIETKMDFDVLYPPSTVVFYTNISGSSLFEGDSIKFTCKSDANPAPTYHIYKDSKPLMIIKSGIFVISSLNITSSGRYECQPKNALRDGARLDVRINVIASRKMTDKEKKLDSWIFILIGVLCFLLLLFVIIVISMIIWRRRKTRKRTVSGSHSSSSKIYQFKDSKHEPSDKKLSGVHNNAYSDQD